MRLGLSVVYAVAVAIAVSVAIAMVSVAFVSVKRTVQHRDHVGVSVAAVEVVSGSMERSRR